MALPVYPITKMKSKSAPKLARSQSLNLHNAKSKPPRMTQLDGYGLQSVDKTGGTRTLPPHMRKVTKDTKLEESQHRSEFSAKIKLLFRRKSVKASRKDGIGASDVTAGSGLSVTANEEEEKCESGSGLPTQAVNLGLSRRLMTTCMLDQNKSDIPRNSEHHSSLRSTRWYEGNDEAEDKKQLCWDLEERPTPALGENGELINEEELKLLFDSSFEGGGSIKVSDGEGNSSSQSPSANQLSTINEEYIEDDLAHHSSALPHLAANGSEYTGLYSSTPAVAMRRVEDSLLNSDHLMNRWSIAGSGIHDSPSLRESVAQNAGHEPTLNNSDVVVLRRDTDAEQDSSEAEARASYENSRTQRCTDSILCDSIDLGMNSSQSMLELPWLVAEDAPRVGREVVLRRSASLTLGGSQKLVPIIFYMLLNLWFTKLSKHLSVLTYYYNRYIYMYCEVCVFQSCSY